MVASDAPAPLLQPLSKLQRAGDTTPVRYKRPMTKFPSVCRGLYTYDIRCKGLVNLKKSTYFQILIYGLPYSVEKRLSSTYEG